MDYFLKIVDRYATLWHLSKVIIHTSVRWRYSMSILSSKKLKWILFSFLLVVLLVGGGFSYMSRQRLRLLASVLTRMSSESPSWVMIVSPIIPRDKLLKAKASSRTPGMTLSGTLPVLRIGIYLQKTRNAGLPNTVDTERPVFRRSAGLPV